MPTQHSYYRPTWIVRRSRFQRQGSFLTPTDPPCPPSPCTPRDTYTPNTTRSGQTRVSLVFNTNPTQFLWTHVRCVGQPVWCRGGASTPRTPPVPLPLAPQRIRTYTPNTTRLRQPHVSLVPNTTPTQLLWTHVRGVEQPVWPSGR